MRNRSNSKHSGIRSAAADAPSIDALVLALALPISASALVTNSGVRGCGELFGWLTATTGGQTVISPPGTYYNYVYASGGTRSRVAMNTTGGPQIGGGNWWTSGATSAHGVPSCLTHG